MTDAVLVGLIAAVPGTLAAIGGLITAIRVGGLKLEINGRMTELLAATKAENQATGHAAGVEAERTREARPLP